ncbi:hypothetical protein D3C84_959540 [compost metagenome]
MAQRDRQVGTTDEQAIDTVDVGDGIQMLEGGGILDLANHRRTAIVEVNVPGQRHESITSRTR